VEPWRLIEPEIILTGFRKIRTAYSILDRGEDGAVLTVVQLSQSIDEKTPVVEVSKLAGPVAPPVWSERHSSLPAPALSPPNTGKGSSPAIPGIRSHSF
jgi:hypothetical protein